DRLVARLVADHVGHVQRRGQVVDDAVQDGLDALVLERGAAEDRVGLRGDGEGADAGLQLLEREVAPSRYLSMSSSELSATSSTSLARYSSTVSWRSSGIGISRCHWPSAGSPFLELIAFMSSSSFSGHS